MSKHIGFKKLTKKIEGEGKSEKSAKAIAAVVGRKKYGEKAMAKAASCGKPLKESQAKKK